MNRIEYSKLRAEMIRKYKSNLSILKCQYFNLSNEETLRLKKENENIKIKFNL